jgi:hypothetical protein
VAVFITAFFIFMSLPILRRTVMLFVKNGLALSRVSSRLVFPRTCLLLSILGLSGAFACAQTLQHLTIPLLSMSVDRTNLPLDAPLHLSIHAHVEQTITQLDNITLPSLPDFAQVSHETHYLPAAHGTDFTETLTLKPKRTGDFTIPQVYIDAINEQTNKPSRFTATDTIVIHVGASANKDGQKNPFTNDFARYASIAVISFLSAYLAFRIGGVISDWVAEAYRAWRSRPKPSVPDASNFDNIVKYESPTQRLRVAIVTLRHDPSVTSAEEVRWALRDALAAGEEETLEDIVARIAPADRGVFERALRAAERAAFINTNLRRSAIDEGLPIFELALQRLEK